ncbi:HAD family hydrolase [Companilactobacillus baiquanensis]|uniref:HAD family hydrolase n=1 Tax=Companilactobacillus baiquanensis TaxID=2486005 RepID=A0ABW1UWR0_9LACO|nr:HAD family hydrolase [Companilactobacillus baiquanensis]
MIKHIFSDMDNTLLNEIGVVSEGNIKAIKDSKIPFTLVSARAPMEMKDTIDKLNLTSAQIAFNGGLIFKPANNSIEKISEHNLPLKTVEEIIDQVKSNFPDVSVSTYDTDNWYSEKIDFGIEYESKITSIDPTIVNFKELFANKNDNFFKIMLITPTAKEVIDLHKFITNLNIENISVQQSGNNYLEVTNIDAQKSHGIKYVQNLNKLDKSELAAFGDGHNDIPMLKMVAKPIIMANAVDEVKKYSNLITKSNIEDGVAFGIQKFIVN